MQGPGTAALLDAASPDDDDPWLAMEFVPGLPLKDHVQRHGTLNASSGIALALGLAGALATSWGDNGPPTHRHVWFHLAYDMADSAWSAA